MNALVRCATSIASILLFTSSLAVAQAGSAAKPLANAEALVNCPELIVPEPLTPYGFAKSTLVSLWYARNAADVSEIEKARKLNDYFSWLTAMMRVIKASNNEFICAKRSVKPFTVKATGENISTASTFLMLIYDKHIDINNRMLDILKNLGSTDQVTLADRFSTLQTERDQRWADLITPTTLALASLIDLQHPDAKGHASRLIITKVQKETLLDWADEHFTEFKNGTPKKQWSEPAKTAEIYFTFLNDHTCSDE